MHRYLLAIAAGAMACGRYPAGQATVTIAVSGPGAVRTSNLNGDCRATCWFSVDREVPVHLEPIPGSQAVFAGWTGGCHGTGTCDLKPALDVSVAATFMPATPRRLQVSLNGAGEVRSDPPGIDCPQSCAANFPEGTSVTLYPSAAAGWGFTGFGGACAGPACTITLAADAAAVATFILNPVELALQVTGGGSVVSTPAAIDCPGVCSAIFAPGTAVTLTASATVGSTFAGFSGGCTGPSCSLRLTAPASVSAAFALIPTFKVTVVTAGNGVGRVTSSPAGIDCPGTCGTIFPVDTAVTLSAAADALSKFAGFDGTCSGAACTLRVAADAAVVAKFDPRRYAARDLSVPGGGWWTAPTGISRTGTLVAGTWGGSAQQMFVWDGAIHDSGIFTPWVGGVNEYGVVVGSINAESGWHAFRWKAGLVTDLGTLGGPSSNALGVNGDGIVAGWSMRADGVQRAVAWTAQGIVDLGSLVDGGCSYANGINSAGVIVGSTCTAAAGVRAARFRGPGIIDDLGSFGGTTIALAINDSGLIVGYSYLPNGTFHGFVYSDGKMIDAGTLPGMPYTQLAAVNGDGLAVGHATDGMVISHAVLYGGGRMVDLNSVVDETPYTLGSASGIDEAGNIVVTTTNGPMRALLLCPQ